jgi:hypothetical protein
LEVTFLDQAVDEIVVMVLQVQDVAAVNSSGGHFREKLQALFVIGIDIDIHDIAF